MEKIKKWCSALVLWKKRAQPTKLPLKDAPFQYPPIGAPKDIRVLDILPGNFNSEIHFRLRKRRLGDWKVYYALSYAWGPPDFTHKIYSAEGYIQVTQNLWQALRRYREANKIITLWVDAVCIDQANIRERSQQIVLMRRIYSESKHVLIWLGLESPSVLLAFEFIKRVVDLAVGRGIDNMDTMIDVILPMRTNEYQHAVTGLFAMSWFSRVWTYQEISCAADATLTSGSLDIEFEYIHLFCLIWLYIEDAVWLKSNAAARALGQVAGLDFTKGHLSDQSPVNSLFELVKRTRNRLATDPRDMIYGLVALASDKVPLPFAPTYEIAVNHLYEEFAAHVIRQNKRLDVFECCTFQPVVRECPSWVPDWRFSDEYALPINLEKGDFRAAGTSCWDTSTAIVNHSLGVEAICLDRVQNITSPRTFPKSHGLIDWGNDLLPLGKWHHDTIRETMEMTSLSLLYRSDRERWHAWWWTYIGEQKRDLGRATPDYERLVRSYKEIIDRLVNHGPYTETEIHKRNEFAEIWVCATRMALHRRFCLSREGRIGWVPYAAQEGDIVSLMRGSPVPVIIRPVQRENSYLMIGQCYIHGIMDGEAVAGKEDQFRRIQLV